MSGLDHSLILLVLVSVQVLGLLSATLARLTEGSSYQGSSHRLFLGCLALVGLTTMGALILVGSGGWLTSGTTFSLMVLAATCDFRRSDRQSADWSIHSRMDRC
jgi:hypothetical protein